MISYRAMLPRVLLALITCAALARADAWEAIQGRSLMENGSTNPLWMWLEIPLKYQDGEVVLYDERWSGGGVSVVRLTEYAGRDVDWTDDSIEEYWNGEHATTGESIARGSIGDRFFHKLSIHNVSTIKFDPDTGMMDVTDLMPSITSTLSTPVE